MKRDQDRRRSQRFPQLLEIKAGDMPHRGASDVPTSITGRVRNLSSVGLCDLSEQCAQRLDVLRCEIFSTGVPIGVPTLAQVGWKGKQTASYPSGPQFLF
jgi:hypothetical protein